jgi:hypothetical protein
MLDERFTFLHEVSACLNVQHISFFLTSLILMAGQVTALVIMFAMLNALVLPGQ